jgi:hypothetical protein
VSYKRAADEEALPLYLSDDILSGKVMTIATTAALKHINTKMSSNHSKSLSKKKTDTGISIGQKNSTIQRALNAHIGEYNSMCILTNAYRRGYSWIFVIQVKEELLETRKVCSSCKEYGGANPFLGYRQDDFDG